MTKLYKLLNLALTIILVIGCSKEQAKPINDQSTYEYKLPEVPLLLTDSAEISKYIALHYWDNYDFNDTTLIHRSSNCEELFVNFIGLLQKEPIDIASRSIKTMMQKAQTNSTVFSCFMTLSERYLYNPTSPVRNDEFYIPALEVIVSSKLIDESHKIRPLYQLKMARKNRVGTKATDLNFILPQGKSQRIYEINSMFTLLYFYNPDCHTCREILLKMENSAMLTKLTANKTLKIVAIDTNGDNEEWLKYKTLIPDSWINGWDKSQEINSGNKYDLKASPTFYLLDKNKIIVLKDAQIELIINYLGNIK